MAEGIKVTPLDIQQKRFHVVFRGYDKTEVEMFLDLVRDEMEFLVREVTELRDFKDTYDQRMRELVEKEDSITKLMQMTQKLMEEQKDNARREAALIIKDADIRGRQIVDNASNEKVKLETDIRELQRRRHQLIEDLKKVIQTFQGMVDFEEAGSGAKEKASAE